MSKRMRFLLDASATGLVLHFGIGMGLIMAVILSHVWPNAWTLTMGLFFVLVPAGGVAWVLWRWG